MKKDPLSEILREYLMKNTPFLLKIADMRIFLFRTPFFLVFRTLMRILQSIEWGYRVGILEMVEKRGRYL